MRKFLATLLFVAGAATFLVASSPTFYPEGNTATSYDNELRVLQKILGALHDGIPVTGAVGGGAGGDASAANQTSVQASPGSDATKAVAVQGVTGGKAIPISASALPLATGAATSANQTTSNTSLSSIATNTGRIPAQGAAATAASIPVNIASDQTVSIQPVTQSTAAFRNIALSSTAAQVKGSAGSIYGYKFINTNTVPVYIKFYDALAVNVTVGTTTPTSIMMVPASNGTTPGMIWLAKNGYSHGTYATGITVACVTGIADSSTAAPSTGLYVELGYL